MIKQLYHVIKSKTKTGKTRFAVRPCSIDSYNLRMKTHEDDGLYFETREAANAKRDELVRGCSDDGI